MEKKSIAVILLVIALVFLAISAILVYSVVSFSSTFSLKKSTPESSGGQVKLYVEGNEFSEVGK